jgi:hypothetical protein
MHERNTHKKHKENAQDDKKTQKERRKMTCRARENAI